MPSDKSLKVKGKGKGKSKKDRGAVDVESPSEENVKSRGKHRGKLTPFDKDVRLMMHAFGDVENPRDESVELMGSLVMNFMTHITELTANLSSCRKDKLRPENLLFVIRRDRAKYQRATKQLKAQDYKKAKQAMKGA